MYWLLRFSALSVAAKWLDYTIPVLGNFGMTAPEGLGPAVQT